MLVSRRLVKKGRQVLKGELGWFLEQIAPNNHYV